MNAAATSSAKRRKASVCRMARISLMMSAERLRCFELLGVSSRWGSQVRVRVYNIRRSAIRRDVPGRHILLAQADRRRARLGRSFSKVTKLNIFEITHFESPKIRAPSPVTPSVASYLWLHPVALVRTRAERWAVTRLTVEDLSHGKTWQGA